MSTAGTTWAVSVTLAPSSDTANASAGRRGGVVVRASRNASGRWWNTCGTAGLRRYVCERPAASGTTMRSKVAGRPVAAPG